MLGVSASGVAVGRGQKEAVVVAVVPWTAQPRMVRQVEVVWVVVGMVTVPLVMVKPTDEVDLQREADSLVQSLGAEG